MVAPGDVQQVRNANSVVAIHAPQGIRAEQRSFCWRVNRVADHGFITRHLLPMVHLDPIFAVASSGEHFGALYSGPEAGPVVRTDGSGVLNALGVNAVHLELLRSDALVSWENEIEIRWRNELSNSKYVKEYYAIITPSLGSRELQFALEYERTPKTRAEYNSVVSVLEQERNIDRVLYLACTHHIHSLLETAHVADKSPRADRYGK